MKVTVSFNGTKIVVPCGDGDISVKELTQLASTRYKKAIGKPNETYWISVMSLKSHEGGMLDPDDRICDVCDDREQLDAIFDERRTGFAGGHLHLGDGMSSEEDRMSGLSNEDIGLHIHRGQEPVHLDRNLSTPTNQMVTLGVQQQHAHFIHPFSAHSSNSTLVAKEEHLDAQQQQHYSNNNQEHNNFDSLPDSQSFETKCSLHVLRRREPLGASANKPEKGKGGDEMGHNNRLQMVRPSVEVIIVNEIGPLGIHVVPCTEDGRLIVQGIEPGGRVDRDGRLAVGDEIVEINGYSLTTVTFTKAQEIFKEALFAKELRLQVIKGVSGMNFGSFENNKENYDLEGSNDNKSRVSGASEAPPVGSKVTTAVQANNTRKIGTVISIKLKKGVSGLGFSITTRDNAPGGSTPVYIKNILPKGAAIEEGSLKPGDRLLEVNSTPVDGMSQSEVVALLRNVPTNSELVLSVSRHLVNEDQNTLSRPVQKVEKQQESQDEQDNAIVAAESRVKVPNDFEYEEDKQPRSLSTPSTDNYESYDENFSFPWKQREILTFDIPVHDSERAGLGVSVKGKTSSNSEGKVVDLGIFVKSVIHGGAASRDGRLKTNDQLVNINGMSLLQKANPQAMETLRKAMHEEGPLPGIISLTVARQSFDTQGPNSQFGGLKSDHKRTDSLSSQVTSSSDDIVREYNVSHSSARQFKSPKESISSLKNTRNPVLDRLMGKESAGIVPANIRNDSYYMATHETWNSASMMMPKQQQQRPPKDLSTCPTVLNTNNSETLMIEQDQTTDSSNNTRESMISLVDSNLPGFSRDQPGRQSMSEKRHATLDAKATDTYQKRKKARDDRLKMQQGGEKSLRWKKSASVESLHMIGHTDNDFLTQEEREIMRTQYVGASSVRVSRGRGCNESFRQAVDRSYENEMPGTSPAGGGQGGAIEGEDYEIQDFDESSERSRETHEKTTKGNKSKILRNFGAMFRLGSGSSGHSRSKSANRKSMPSIHHNQPSSSVPLQQQQHTKTLPSSSSVPNYKDLYKNKSEIQPTNEFKRPSDFQFNNLHQANAIQQQQQPQKVYDYLPSAMMRPGSRVAIADPGINTATSDYEVIQRHLHNKNRVTYGNNQPQMQQPGQQLQQQQQPFQQTHVQHRSQSNPRMRPKSNFYEYDMWQYQPRDQEFLQQQQHSQQHPVPQQQQQPRQSVFREPPAVPQKPSRPMMQEHFQHQTLEQQPHAVENPYASYYYGMRQQQPYYGRTVAAPGAEVNPVGATHFSLPRGQNINLP